MLTETIEGFRLSPQQEHLWLLQQVERGSAYRVYCTILITVNLNTNNLVAALQDIVNRHEIFRTTFQYVPGMSIPVQVITNTNVILDDQHNLYGYNSQEQEAKIEEIFQEFNQRDFDFEKGLPLHTSLVTLSPAKHILFISLPALCADTTTLSNFVGELSRSYANSLHGEQPSEEPLQYADFSEWQNEFIESEKAEIGREYWRKQDLSDILSFQLPFEKKIAEVAEFKPEFVTLTIDGSLKVNIEAIAQKYNTSTSVLILTCWSVLIWRLTQQSNLIVGTAFDGRRYKELQEAMGLFAKYLPLSCHLEDNLQFQQVLQQVGESEHELHKWQECFSWEFIANQDSDYVDLPYYPVCFDFEKDYVKFADDNISFSIEKQYTCIERFKINLSCVLNNNALIAKFYYDSQLFDAEDIQRLSEQFHKLVESATKNPEAVIGKLEILSDRDRQQLLNEFNQTQADYPLDKCIHHLFEEQVELTPNNIAVAFENQQLSYAELNARANKIAHYLQRLGVGSEVLVGICVERSLEMLIGILGILKAGGAYVPMDPAYPQERLSFMVEDAKIPILLTQQRLLKGLPQHTSHVICLDTDWEDIAQHSQMNPISKSDPNNLVYVIYTSGSTGKPKGVQITHRNLVHSTSARITYYQERVTSFLLLSSFAFDSSVAGIFWTLCQGGFLCLPQEGMQRELPKLINLIAQYKVSHLLCLPSLYALLLEEAKPEQIVSLRTVIVAGEPCPIELIQRHHQLCSKTSLFNEYGPTEATVWSSVCHCGSQEMRSQVSIGRPIANTQIYVLDSHLHPVPLGVSGELYISGDGLARGYLNQPELTAAKFILNPFAQIQSVSSEPRSRLYKTGDLARYLSDGNIEFLGRVDHQVKIRGYRIELGEIEVALKQHPTVQEVVVVATQESEQPTSLASKNILSDKRLVAYIVANQQPSPSISELRSFLMKKLPEYMVPSAFVLLKDLPRLPNGKIDYGALPKKVQLELEKTFVAPQSELEQIIAKIWQEVLHVDKVGIHHNFFDLGGHSLLMVQVHTKLREALKKDISMIELFEYPTINTLAKHLNQQLEKQPSFRPSHGLVETRRESNQQQRQLRQKHRPTSN